jgi:predicted RNase H-like HicB family nuclease
LGDRKIGMLDWASEVISDELQLTAVFEEVPEGYVAYVEELPGANTQGRTLEEARANLAEAVELVFETNRLLAEERLGTKKVIREPLSIGA